MHVRWLLPALRGLQPERCAALNVDVLAGVDEFPVGIDGICDGGDGLLRKSQISDLAIIFGDDDVAAIREEPETVQQLL